MPTADSLVKQPGFDSYPAGTVLIEVHGLYDGWSIAKYPDGSLHNRWPEDDYRHARTQAWIDRQMKAAGGDDGRG